MSKPRLIQDSFERLRTLVGDEFEGIDADEYVARHRGRHVEKCAAQMLQDGLLSSEKLEDEVRGQTDRLQRHRELIEDVYRKVIEKAILFRLLDGPLDDVLADPERREKVATHCSVVEYTNAPGATTQVPPIGLPNGAFSEWTLVREWLWTRGDATIVLAQEHQRALSSRFVFAPDDMIFSDDPIADG